MTVRSQDSNGKALLAQAFNHTDWTSLYHLQTCDEMVNAFYSTLSGLIDHKHNDFCCFKGVTYDALTLCYKLISFLH